MSGASCSIDYTGPYCAKACDTPMLPTYICACYRLSASNTDGADECLAVLCALPTMGMQHVFPCLRVGVWR